MTVEKASKVAHVGVDVGVGLGVAVFEGLKVGVTVLDGTGEGVDDIVTFGEDIMPGSNLPDWLGVSNADAAVMALLQAGKSSVRPIK